ncbi:hypothetical protein BDR26DRAFT_921959 [Obelidium mucronatum]|nr:hypothetical protein BDR26DRAFT_921959 [Obelidium mucronatum]
MDHDQRLLLFCTHCRQPLTAPVTLPCGWSVCLGCLDALEVGGSAPDAAAAPASAPAHTLFGDPHALAPRRLVRCPAPRGCGKRLHRRAAAAGVDVVAQKLVALARAQTQTQTQTQAGDLLRAVAAEVECCLCCAVFAQPVTAPCGHSFCRQCAVETRNKCRPACPVCRQLLPGAVYFERRPTNKLIATTVEWVKACLNIPPVRPPVLRHASSSSSLQCFLNSLPRCSPAQPPIGPPKLLKNQFIIPIFVSCKTILPGVPCFMQFFEPRYRRMILKLMEINRKRGDEECQLDSMVYGVCVKVPLEQNLNTVAGIKRRRSANSSADTIVVTGGDTLRNANSNGRSSPACAALFGRSVFGGACCSSLPSTYSSAPESPWITPSATRPGSTSEYMEFGTALKLRSVRPIFDNPPPNHDPSTPDACRTGAPATTNTTTTSGDTTLSGRNTSNSSGSSEYYEDNDDDDDMDIDEEEEEEEEGWSSSGDEETPLRLSSSRSRPTVSSSAPGQPLPSLPQQQRQHQQQQQQQQAKYTCPEPSRYLVDGIGSWRFKVLERGVCDDGLNLALVERIEDLDFEDEECVGLDVVNGAIDMDNQDISGHGGVGIDGKQNREVCTMAECDCSASKRAKTRPSTHSTSTTIYTTSSNQQDILSTAKYEEPKSTVTTAAAQNTSSIIPRGTTTSRLSTVPTPDSADNYTCPMSEFFKSTHLSSFAKCMYSGVQYLACTKQPPFPFDLTLPLESESLQQEHHKHDHHEHHYHHLHHHHHDAKTGHLQLVNLRYSKTQAAYILSLYQQLSRLVQEIIGYLNASFLEQQQKMQQQQQQQQHDGGPVSCPSTAYANALHFKLIHGDVPTLATAAAAATSSGGDAAEALVELMTFWVANLLDVNEVVKNELLRDDIGGVDGRVEWVLHVVEELRRSRGGGDEGSGGGIAGLLKVKF